MRKIFVKYNILVNGLNTTDECQIDDFVLKKGNINDEYFKEIHNISSNGMPLDFNKYVLTSINDYKDKTYRYLENKELFEYNINRDYDRTKKNQLTMSDYYQDILDVPLELEKKLRLVLNIPLCFVIINMVLFDENKEKIGFCETIRHIPNSNRCLYNLDPKVFANNSRFHINYDSFKKINNNHYKRALEFYNDSFESDKISIRYILIFSSLEAIFNLDSRKVNEKLAKYSAKLLSETKKEEYEKINKDMKALYKKRCSYIHGSDREVITIEDEKLLRNYARKIIIAYGIMAFTFKKSSKKILEYLDSKEKLDIQIRLVITALNSLDFTEQQNNIIDLIQNEYGIVIPEETKNSILSKTNK